MKKKVTWIIVADGSRARVLANDGPGKGLRPAIAGEFHHDAPLSHLPYRVSYALHTLLMVGATVAALYLVRPMLPLVDRHFELAVIGAVAFYPMYRAITGGQNTALTLLLLAGEL